MTRATTVDPLAAALNGARPPIDLLEPALERHGDELTVRWAEHRVDLVFTGIREGSDGLHAELSIRRDGEEVHWSRLGLASSRTRTGVIKELKERTDGGAVPWTPMCTGQRA